MCDTPRVQAQVERTLESAIGAAHVMLYLDGEPLDEALSAGG